MVKPKNRISDRTTFTFHSFFRDCALPNAQRQLKYHGISKMSFTSWGMITLQTDGHKWIVSQEIRPVRRSQFRQYRKDHSWIQFPADLP